MPSTCARICGKLLLGQRRRRRRARWRGKRRSRAGGCCPASRRLRAWPAPGRDRLDPPARLGGRDAGQEMARPATRCRRAARAAAARDREHVEPVEQVLAEAAVLDLLQQVAMGRRDQPDVDLTVERPPTGSTSPSCTARSSLTWTSSGRSPISSRNSVPPCASTNLPVCLSVAPVKAPFSWPNRIVSTRLSGIAPQLTVTKGLRGAVAGALDGARHQFLADAGFALDQDRDVRRGRLAGEPQHPVHGRAAGDEVVEGERARSRVAPGAARLDLARLDLERVGDRRAQPLGRGRLDHEVEGAVRASPAPRSRCRPARSGRSPAGRCRARAIAFSTPRPSRPGMTRSRIIDVDRRAGRPFQPLQRGKPVLDDDAPHSRSRVTAASSRRRCTGSSSTMRMRSDTVLPGMFGNSDAAMSYRLDHAGTGS